MKNLVCPHCHKNILQEFIPKKKIVLYGTRDGVNIEDCGIHEVIEEFDTEKEVIIYLRNTNPEPYTARFISDQSI